jgi:hypothetical protein
VATKPTKKPSKRRPPLVKSKAKRRNSAQLLASTTAIRRAKTTPAVVAPVASDPALLMLNMMERVIAAYVELPGSLARCRTPMDFWLVPLHLTQRIFRS